MKKTTHQHKLYALIKKKCARYFFKKMVRKSEHMWPRVANHSTCYQRHSVYIFHFQGEKLEKVNVEQFPNTKWPALANGHKSEAGIFGMASWTMWGTNFSLDFRGQPFVSATLANSSTYTISCSQEREGRSTRVLKC